MTLEFEVNNECCIDTDRTQLNIIFSLLQDMEKEIRKEIDEAIAQAKVGTTIEVVVLKCSFFCS